jgi:hypothetical protein
MDSIRSIAKTRRSSLLVRGRAEGGRADDGLAAHGAGEGAVEQRCRGRAPPIFVTAIFLEPNGE